jgi:hypothetical protein
MKLSVRKSFFYICRWFNENTHDNYRMISTVFGELVREPVDSPTGDAEAYSQSMKLGVPAESSPDSHRT